MNLITQLIYATTQSNKRGTVQLRVYPTILPSGNAITIEANEAIDGVELRMYDMQSRHVRSFRLNSFYKGSSVSIRVEDVPGMYVLKAQDAIHSFTQKIIIQ